MLSHMQILLHLMAPSLKVNLIFVYVKEPTCSSYQFHWENTCLAEVDEAFLWESCCFPSYLIFPLSFVMSSTNMQSTLSPVFFFPKWFQVEPLGKYSGDSKLLIQLLTGSLNGFREGFCCLVTVVLTVGYLMVISVLSSCCLIQVSFPPGFSLQLILSGFEKLANDYVEDTLLSVEWGHKWWTLEEV